MSLRILKVLAPDTQKEKLKNMEEAAGVIEHWTSSKSRDGQREFNYLVLSEHVQNLTDSLQRNLSKEKDWRVIITPVETTIPRFEEGSEKENGKGKKTYGRMTREALYDQLLRGARTDYDFYILVFLSTLVTAIGILTDNPAVIIGAMVIAPLLGPNLALSFGTTLGDDDMVRQALRANAIGFGFTLVISILTGIIAPYDSYALSYEFLQRTDVGYGGIILALASGAAGVLSLTGGVSSTMVGVMVAVALMPPAVTMGLSFGAGNFALGYGAGLLLAINIICVNLAANSVFILKGIRPRTWYRRKKSQQSLKTSLAFWVVWLLILSFVIYLRQYK
jgi:uncharacterized hydrophobic protein (TIGR00341 family)